MDQDKGIKSSTEYPKGGGDKPDWEIQLGEKTHQEDLKK